MLLDRHRRVDRREQGAGVRAALCADAATAEGARRWNDANVLALSLRTTSEAELAEILDAWFAGEPSAEDDDVANVEHLGEIEHLDYVLMPPTQDPSGTSKPPIIRRGGPRFDREAPFPAP